MGGIMLYSTVLYNTLLISTKQYYRIFHSRVGIVGYWIPHMLYYTILYSNVLYNTVMYCTIQYCTILYRITSNLYMTTIAQDIVTCIMSQVLHSLTLPSILHCAVLYSELHNFILLHCTVLCSVFITIQ